MSPDLPPARQNTVHPQDLQVFGLAPQEFLLAVSLKWDFSEQMRYKCFAFMIEGGGPLAVDEGL